MAISLEDPSKNTFLGMWTKCYLDCIIHMKSHHKSIVIWKGLTIILWKPFSLRNKAYGVWYTCVWYKFEWVVHDGLIKKTPAMTQLIEKFVSYISYLDYAANNHLTERVRIKYFLNKFIVVFILLYLNL